MRKSEKKKKRSWKDQKVGVSFSPIFGDLAIDGLDKKWRKIVNIR
jgi:hypothetical protein